MSEGIAAVQSGPISESPSSFAASFMQKALGDTSNRPQQQLERFPGATASPGAVFARIFAVTVGVEGGVSMDPRDAGNWSDGEVGKGTLVGTAWGISAPNLVRDGLFSSAKEVPEQWARGWYFKNFLEVGCDLLAPGMAMTYFDAWVNNGSGAASHLAALALDKATFCLKAEGAALMRRFSNPTDQEAWIAEFFARRTHMMTGLAVWKIYGNGFCNRLFHVHTEALRLTFAGLQPPI